MGPESESPWKYILIGCAVVVGILILGGVGTCVFMGDYINKHKDDLVNFGQKMASSGMKMGKAEYLTMLTSDHTEAQRGDFSNYFDIMTDLMGENIKGFYEKYGPTYQQFTTITRDGHITVRESTEWVNNFDSSLRENGYWDAHPNELKGKEENQLPDDVRKKDAEKKGSPTLKKYIEKNWE